MKHEVNENGIIGTQRVQFFIRGLSKEEKQIAVDSLPIELIYNRIGRELQEKADLEKAVAMLQQNIIKGKES